jgi:hypothetical protein
LYNTVLTPLVYLSISEYNLLPTVLAGHAFSRTCH